MKLRYIALVLIMASVVVSYLYSDRLYTFYLGTYYTHVKEMSAEDMEKSLEKLYKEEKYDEMVPLVHHARTLHPGNTHIRLLYGFYLMGTGRVEDGAGVIITTRKSIASFDDFLQVVEVLDRHNFHAGVINLIEGQSRFSNSYLQFYLGKAYYHQKNYRKAREHLRRSRQGGYDRYTVYYYLALTEEGDGYLKNALKYMEKAYEMNSLDRNVIRAMVRLYRKNGMYEKASDMGKRVSRES